MGQRGRANARPMTGSAISVISGVTLELSRMSLRSSGLLAIFVCWPMPWVLRRLRRCLTLVRQL
jgi:hypothetical protein